MKILINILLFLIFTISINAQSNNNKYVIVIHGGAGYFARETPDSVKQVYLDALSEALIIGQKILSEGGSSLDAVEKTV